MLTVSSPLGAWRSGHESDYESLRGLHLRYAWLACNLEGTNCSPVPGLRTQSITPPQELEVVTLRAVVTATNRWGSTAVETTGRFYDMAGLVFDADERPFIRDHLQYDPRQLRAWYGLDAGETGAGQTIVLPEFGRVTGLRSVANSFSRRYGLPEVCRGSQTSGCFDLAVSYAGKEPTRVLSALEPDADVEWAHAIAPDATIVVVQFDHVLDLFPRIRMLAIHHRASVVSDSWCDPCRGGGEFARLVYRAVATGCHQQHLVCVQAAGDHGAPGEEPSNSPYLLAVGGTEFAATADGAATRELPWPPGGSGETDFPVSRPPWQKGINAGCGSWGDFSCRHRAIPDVSATAKEVPVFTLADRNGENWHFFIGTSLSTPLWAGIIALADQRLAEIGQPPIGIDELHDVLYSGDVAAGLDDIPPAGWDWATGLGSPKAGIVDVLAAAIERNRLENGVVHFVRLLARDS